MGWETGGCKIPSGRYLQLSGVGITVVIRFGDFGFFFNLFEIFQNWTVHPPSHSLLYQITGAAPRNEAISLLFTQEYEFNLTCKTGIGREFKLHCRAVGVLPPLELSSSVIKMKATALRDTSSMHFDVINTHTSANEFTHPVPRIGSGPIVEVGPTSFEFVVPPGVPLTVSPAVGTVDPGEVRGSLHVQLLCIGGFFC